MPSLPDASPLSFVALARRAERASTLNMLSWLTHAATLAPIREQGWTEMIARPFPSACYCSPKVRVPCAAGIGTVPPACKQQEPESYASPSLPPVIAPVRRAFRAPQKRDRATSAQAERRARHGAGARTDGGMARTPRRRWRGATGGIPTEPTAPHPRMDAPPYAGRASGGGGAGTPEREARPCQPWRRTAPKRNERGEKGCHVKRPHPTAIS